MVVLILYTIMIALQQYSKNLGSFEIFHKVRFKVS
jgi:hypothetical protein